MRIEKLNQTTKKNLLEDLLKRSPNSYEMYEEQVKAILDNVKKRGDEALFEYTEKFDGFCLDQQSVLVKEEEIEEAYTQVDRGLIEIIRKALKNIETYHEKQRQYSWFDSKPDGTILGQKVTALDRVLFYNDRGFINTLTYPAVLFPAECLRITHELIGKYFLSEDYILQYFHDKGIRFPISLAEFLSRVDIK